MLKEKKTKAGEIKAEAARARKNAEAEIRKAVAEREEEDKYWKDAGSTLSRGAMKRVAAANKRAEAIARKAETRRLEEQEKMELEKRLKNKTSGMNVRKITESELLVRKDIELAEMQKKAEETKRRRSRVMNEEEYGRMVDVENTNADNLCIEATTVEQAISALQEEIKDQSTTFKAFAEAKMKSLRETKPGLTDSQRHAAIVKLWKRSHLNPANRTEKKTDSKRITMLDLKILVGEDSSY